MIINHNIPALNTYNKLSLTNTGMAKSLEKLSSGLRINRAADDAAGLAISEKMRSQIRGLDQAARNAQDGISLIQTAEGALNETHSILQRMRELSVQAANGTYTSSDRNEIQKEIDQLTEEIDRIANTTEFNGKKLLDGTTSALVSTDSLSTKVYMRDGLRVLDQFGQKEAGGGNYKIEITTTAGKNEVQKTDIFKVKHAQDVTKSEITDLNIKDGRFAQISVAVDNANAANKNDVLHLTINLDNDKSYTLDFDLTAGFSSSDIATAINETEGLKNYITATGGTLDGSTLSLTANCAGMNFSITATVEDNIDPDGTGNGNFAMGNATATTAADVGGPTTTTTVTTLTGSSGVANIATDVAFCVTQASKNITSVILEPKSTLMDGSYSINTARLASTCTDSTSMVACNGSAASVYCISGYSASGICSITSSGTSCSGQNYSLLIEVLSVDTVAGTAEVRYKAESINCSGVASSAGWTNATFCLGSECTAYIFGACGVGITLAATVQAGDKSVINQTGEGTGNFVQITRSADGFSGACVAYTVRLCTDACAYLDNKDLSVNFFQIDGLTGEVFEAKIKLSTDAFLLDEKNAATFDVKTTTAKDPNSIGNLATLDTKLYDIDKFWDASGNFILEKPQTIQLVMGNGNKTSITLSGQDTIQDVLDKMNKAIGIGLGQLKDLGISEADANNFVSFVTDADKDGLEALAGTFVIRSAVAGDAGKITFVGDDATIAALSLTTIQKAENNTYSATVTDVHSGSVVAKDVKISENMLSGVVHQNVDVEFNANLGTAISWDDKTKNWVLEGGADNKGETYVHLADNTMVFHIGANQKQDIGVGIGNMTASSLGINNIQVTSNDLANEAIGKIDKAISMVSSERAKMGAVQNRMEHTINNLTTTAENLTAAESRIRDVDMAKEMMNFTKLQILSNAGTAMLAQANQMPQSVLQLLR